LSAVEALAFEPDAVMISPGPGRPEDSGITLDVVSACAGRIPLFGVCLGHQAIAQSLGGEIVQAPTLMHGKTSMIQHDGSGLFRELPNPFEATRYHSLTVDPLSFPESLVATATTDDGVIMALQHRRWPVWGVQFHPESILTRVGKHLLANFLALADAAGPVAPGACPDGANNGK
jgi:anthranilate synthase component 2